MQFQNVGSVVKVLHICHEIRVHRLGGSKFAIPSSNHINFTFRSFLGS